MKTISVQAPAIKPPLPPPPPSFVGTQQADATNNQFIDMLTTGVREVNSLQTTANASVHDLLTGQSVDSAEVLTSVQKADMAFRLMQQIRNKLVDAYREINQMQI